LCELVSVSFAMRERQTQWHLGTWWRHCARVSCKCNAAC